MQHLISLGILGLLTLYMLTPGGATSVQDQFRFLLDEENNLRQILQAKVQRLQVQTVNLNVSIGISIVILTIYYTTPFYETGASREAFRITLCPSCVLRHASCGVKNSFEHILLPNHWANFNQTWQELSLGSLLKKKKKTKLFTEFDSIKNSSYHCNQMEFFMQFFKNFFL